MTACKLCNYKVIHKLFQQILNLKNYHGDVRALLGPKEKQTKQVILQRSHVAWRLSYRRHVDSTLKSLE